MVPILGPTDRLFPFSYQMLAELGVVEVAYLLGVTYEAKREGLE